MRLNVCRRSITAPEPSPRAACSREIRWRSTSTCFCTEVRSPSSWENASFIAGSASTAGRIRSKRLQRARSFFAQPGNGWPRRFRASRIRDVSTAPCSACPPVIQSAGCLIRVLKAHHGSVSHFVQSCESHRGGRPLPRSFPRRSPDRVVTRSSSSRWFRNC